LAGTIIKGNRKKGRQRNLKKIPLPKNDFNYFFLAAFFFFTTFFFTAFFTAFLAFFFAAMMFSPPKLRYKKKFPKFFGN